MIRTVNGDILPEDVGKTLIHEHLFIDLYDVNSDPDVVIKEISDILNDLEEAKQYGLKTVIDATTEQMGRQVDSLIEVSNNLGINVIAATGYYLPQFYYNDVAEKSIDELVEIMSREINEGIKGSKVRAGIIGEVGTSPGGITSLENKVFEAIAKTQNNTNVPVVTHTPNGEYGLQQLSLFEKYNANLNKIVIGHMDCNLDIKEHMEIAKRGAFVGFDRIGLDKYQPDCLRIKNVLHMLDKGFEDRIVFSMDMSRQSRLKVNGGSGFSYIFTSFIPELKKKGVDDNILNKILVENPQRLLDMNI